ncbi:MAG: FliH/SctL family protein [Kistimonas sp.]|nr:FliH/SctL family protein [Kistimonas sp.]
MSRRYLFLARYKFPEAGSVGTPDRRAARAQVMQGYERLHARGYRQGWRRGCQEGRVQGRQQGYEEGWQSGLELGRAQGYEKAMASGEQDCQRLLVLVHRLWQQLTGYHKEHWKQLHRELTTLVDTICRRVLCHELKTSDQVLDQVVRKAMEMLPREDSMQVFVHPEEEPLITRLSTQLPGVWTVCSDSDLQQGDCVIKAGSGTADARMETRLSLCLQSLSHILEGGNGAC